MSKKRKKKIKRPIPGQRTLSKTNQRKMSFNIRSRKDYHNNFSDILTTEEINEMYEDYWTSEILEKHEENLNSTINDINQTINDLFKKLGIEYYTQKELGDILYMWDSKIGEKEIGLTLTVSEDEETIDFFSLLLDCPKEYIIPISLMINNINRFIPLGYFLISEDVGDYSLTYQCNIPVSESLTDPYFFGYCYLLILESIEDNYDKLFKAVHGEFDQKEIKLAKDDVKSLLKFLQNN